MKTVHLGQIGPIFHLKQTTKHYEKNTMSEVCQNYDQKTILQSCTPVR